MALFIILSVVALGLFVTATTFSVLLVKGKNKITSSDGKMMNVIFLLAIAFALAFVGMLLSIYSWNNITPKVSEILFTILCGLIAGFTAVMALSTFIVHYYGKYLDAKLDKNLFIILMVSFPVFIVSLMYTTNGFAEYVTYPLANGISFSKGFVSPTSADRPNIAFYALCILSGAIYVYFLCDHKFYLEYGKHGILESTFLVAFPAGILGARIWYVIGNWSKEFAGQEWWKPFAIWEGGLTILGGAIMGIVVGVLWFLWRNKKYNIFLAVDIIVPTILIAQAVGRWGNFFNCEVHGNPVDESYFLWLPRFITKNAHFSVDREALAMDGGKIYLPLFFIESCMNLFGYFVIAHVFGRRFRKLTQLGDLAFGYLIWYGLVRALLEPLRSSEYNMGENGYWSWIWAFGFVFFGVLLIVINHIIRFVLSMKKNTLKVKDNWKIKGLIGSIVIAVIGITLIVLGAVRMGSSSFAPSIEFNAFNIGLMVLIFGISVLITEGISIPYLVLGMKNGKNEVSL